MIADSPTLTTRLRDLHDLRETALADALAEATGGTGDDIAVRTAAALLGAVHRMLFEQIQTATLAGHGKARIQTEVTAAADHAFKLLETALDDYATA
jgi:fido (protein-threonine AMPylation protein)